MEKLLLGGPGPGPGGIVSVNVCLCLASIWTDNPILQEFEGKMPVLVGAPAIAARYT